MRRITSEASKMEEIYAGEVSVEDEESPKAQALVGASHPGLYGPGLAG